MEKVIIFRKPPEKCDFLDGYVLDVLTEVIGFGNGSLPLHRAGFVTMRDLYFVDPAAVQQTPCIGEIKFAAIAQFFKLNGLPYPREQPSRPNIIRLHAVKAKAGTPDRNI